MKKKPIYEELHEKIEKIVRESDSYLNIYKFIRKMKAELESGMSVESVSEINDIPANLVSEISKYDMKELMEIQRELAKERISKVEKSERSGILKHLENPQL